MTGIAQQVLSGNRRAIARMISAVENDSNGVRKEMEKLYLKTGKAYRIGITGPPGSGKSTLVDSLTAKLRKENLSVGIIAIDPTSPFTGGALLGDRIRMQGIGLDPDVFIRSMATRGSLGGLCAAASDAADILDASGKDVIITETVGVGQSETEIVRVADTTLVVLCPEAGDAVQTLKAGLMEIADIFVINKCDRDGAGRLTLDVRTMLEFKNFPDNEWRPIVLETAAKKGVGVDTLFKNMEKHKKFLETEGKLDTKRLAAIMSKVKDLVVATIERKAWLDDDCKNIEKMSLEILDGKLTPNQAAENIIGNLRIDENTC